MPGPSAKSRPASISALSCASGTPVMVKPIPVEAKASAASGVTSWKPPSGRGMRHDDHVTPMPDGAEPEAHGRIGEIFIDGAARQGGERARCSLHEPVSL